MFEKPVSRRWCVAFAVVAMGAPAVAEVAISSATFGQMNARSIGPASMSGRVAALDVVLGDHLTIYVGAATGGVWKSSNSGTTFKPIFDEHTQAIGAIRVDPSRSDTVWVGTGESWTRNSVSVGTGVYKSTDAGQTWVDVGLTDTERIAKILVDPRDGDTVYVCATGHLWNGNEERGVFKTTDGGQNWEKVLFVDENTGCGDLAMDPQQPGVLYAGMWQFRRYPYAFESGGPGSGLYRSTDAGSTWERVSHGLPTGELGRIAVAVAPSRPSTVYAVVESENTAMYRSDDLGRSWRRTGTDPNVEGRPFYFALLYVDPHDFKRVYKPGTATVVSADGGETFSGLGGATHGDHHALWINPENPAQLILGTDGGVYLSNDRGITWSFIRSLPLSQFYQISYDMEDPYNVYGGLQDNGTWMGPSQAPGGVKGQDWDNIGFGDGFHAYVDRGDANIVYVEWQGGRIQRVNKTTRETKNIQPLPRAGEPKLRFNWNTPIHLSEGRTDTMYLGAQFLLRSRDRGESWERLSDDLTTNAPEKQQQLDSGGLTADNSTAENHCTIYTISESALDDNVIWVGTDDGNLQVTRNGGGAWSNVTANVPDLPRYTWVTHVEAGRHLPGEAFVTFDGHRTGDMSTYVYRTTDFGKTWTRLNGDDLEGYALCIRQDLVNPDLLFLGTEFGLFISLDRGGQWARFKGNLPKVGVRALSIHPREHDLIIATHGRGVYIIDDITPLRSLTGAVLGESFVPLPSRPSIMRIPANVQFFPGNDEFTGDNPASGAQIAYFLKKRHIFGDLKIEILDDSGEVLATLPGGKRPGVNRAVWSGRRKGPTVPPAASLVPQMFSFLGPQVAEGTYRVRITQGPKTHEHSVTLVQDPRSHDTAADRQLQDKLVLELYDMLYWLTFHVDVLVDVQSQVAARADALEEDDGLKVALRALAADLESFRKKIVATRKGGFLAGEEQLREKLGWLYGSVNGFEGRPTDSQIEYAEVLRGELDAVGPRLDALTVPALDDLNTQLAQRQLPPIVRMTKVQWEATQTP